MTKQTLVVGAVIALIVAMAPVVLSDVPQLISFQGKLHDNAGNPLTGQYKITFRIYDAESNGAELWSETDSVECDGGLYNVILGLKSPLALSFNGNYWLGMQVTGDAEELSPRYRLVSVPYAFRAAVAESVAGGGSGPDDDWTGAGTGSMYATHLTDNVGIGTTSPAAKLDVTGSSSDPILKATNNGSGVGVYGLSSTGKALYGLSFSDVGVYGESYTGWAGYFSGKVYMSGNVGISPGTINPQRTLDLAAPQATVRLFSTYVGPNIVSRLELKTVDKPGGFSPLGEIVFVDESDAELGNIWFVKDPENNLLGLRVGGTTQMVIEEAGNVGIGTTNPGVRLEAKSSGTGDGLLITSSDGDPLFRVRQASGGHGGVYVCDASGGDAVVIGGAGNTYFNNTGNVGIGTTNPGTNLHVRYSDSGHTPTNVGGLFVESGGISNSSYIFQTATTGGGKSFSITNTGNVGIGTTSPTEKLDVRGTTRTDVLQITGGSDIAEPFDFEEPDSIEPGMVAVIDPETPGKLKISDRAYDRCVAGIVSGAGGIKPGLMITQEDAFEGNHQVALTGRVYCWADASNGSIEPGDLLTTSDTPGHAMKVTDYTRAQGAIIGKAMTSLGQERGLVLVLVSLQ